MWMTLKLLVARLPWKLIVSALGALAIVAAVWGALRYVERTRDALSASQSALAHEQRAHAEAQARADEWAKEYAAASLRLNALDQANRESAARIARLNRTIRTLNLKELADADPAGAADRLGAVNRDLNRLLERASSGGGDGAGAGDAPDAAGANRP